MDNEALMKIDVDGVLRQRIPRYYRYIPRFIIRWLERTVCQDQHQFSLKPHYPYYKFMNFMANTHIFQ